MATVLYVVCHGETELDIEGVFQGHLDTELSPLGLEQAKRLAQRLLDEQIDSFYSSDLLRAHQTATTIAARHRRGVVKLKQFRDIDCGEWTGKTVAQVEKRYSEALLTWRFQPHRHRMPGGESVEEVGKRVIEAWESIYEKEQGKKTCIVTHAIPAKILMGSFTGDGLSLLWLTPHQESGALNIVEFEGRKAIVREIGSTEHLRGLLGDEG